MKKLFGVILALFLFSIFNFGQEKQAAWQLYKGNSNEFFAEFPSLPKSSEIFETTTAKPIGSLYKTYFNKTFYFVVTCETTACPQFNVIKTLKFRARNLASSKLSEKTLDDSTVESSFVDSEGFFQKIRQIKTEKTYFILHTLSETENNPDIERFFNSFQLKSTSDDAQTFDKEKHDSWLVGDALDVDLPNNTPKDTSNPLSNPDPNLLKKEPSRSVPVTFLTKPPADYTDAARFYEISGQVQLHVTFLSTKTVSTVTPIKKLPFGLTEQAIAAAKEISFNPALSEGKPQTFIKPVIYTFSIY